MNDPSAKAEYLDKRILDPDPIKQFQRWFDEALAANLKLPEAMTLAAATKEGKPSARMVLLKDVDEQGFVFYTNYNSRKAKELASNPVGALLFYWTEQDRQVRIEGTVSKVSVEESDAYFQTRPRDTQLGALASSQSEVVSNRAELDRRFAELEQQYKGHPIPQPAHWGGYRLKPNSIEFWQHGGARMHDRILYDLQEDRSWSMKRLAP